MICDWRLDITTTTPTITTTTTTTTITIIIILCHMSRLHNHWQLYEEPDRQFQIVIQPLSNPKE